MIRNRVREFRKARGLTLEKLEEMTGISTGHLSRIERHEKGWSMESLEASRMRVKVPAVLGDVIAISVVGSSLYPRYNTGDVIIASEPSVQPSNASGKECIVITQDQRVAVKFLQKSADSSTIIATSHNEPPQSDLSIARCYPVVYVVR